MTMLSEIQREFSKIQKQVDSDNRKLDALRLVIREYATEDFPGTERLNEIITECVSRHNGQATFQQIADSIDNHQIMLPRNRLSLLLTKHPSLNYYRDMKIWRLSPVTNE